MKRTLSVLALLFASALYGFTPILAKMTYAQGSNSFNMAFLRAWMAVPALYLICRFRKIPLRLHRDEILPMCAMGLASAATVVLVYTAYNYIGVGLTTSIHFAHPLLVVLTDWLLFGKKAGRRLWIALALGTAGVALLADAGARLAPAGIALALLSALTYTVKLFLMDKSPARRLPAMKMMLYLCLIEGFAAGCAGAAMGRITFALTPTAWLYSAAVAGLVSMVAVPCVKFGIARTGASLASILAPFEPVVSVVLGAMLLGEEMTFARLFGLALIAVGVTLAAIGDPAGAEETEP